MESRYGGPGTGAWNASKLRETNLRGPKGPKKPIRSPQELAGTSDESSRHESPSIRGNPIKAFECPDLPASGASEEQRVGVAGTEFSISRVQRRLGIFEESSLISS